MRTRVFVFTLLVAAVCIAAFGQSVGRESSLNVPVPTPDTYGTSSDTVYTITGWDFAPVNALTTMLTAPDAYRYMSPACCAEGPIHLPNGALINRMELEACDSSATDFVSAQLFRCGDAGTAGTSACTGIAYVITGDSATPGCGRFPVNLTPQQVVNETYKYQVEVLTGTHVDGATAFGGVRIHYKLQVSPDPPTSTFTDVPVGSPYHRFIEALAASGITGGCGGGKYCPNDPVTRGQLAVFLATALGLHFPN